MAYFSVRTSTKLAIAGGVGAALVMGMIANERWLTSQRVLAHDRWGELWNLLVGLLVPAMLVGWALFSVFFIALAIRAVGAVDIRSVWRSDKIGDSARVAKMFSYDLLCIEQKETEPKQVEARATVESKADLYKLADQFQAAVGTLLGAVSFASSEREATASWRTSPRERQPMSQPRS